MRKAHAGGLSAVPRGTTPGTPDAASPQTHAGWLLSPVAAPLDGSWGRLPSGFLFLTGSRTLTPDAGFARKADRVDLSSLARSSTVRLEDCEGLGWQGDAGG